MGFLSMNDTDQRRLLLAGGQILEVWEDPKWPFGCDQAHLQGYLASGDWINLFNALTLIDGPTLAE